MRGFKPLTIKPANGGALITNASAENAGLANYTIKRDWRREGDREIRAEGYVYFKPDTSSSNPQHEPYPSSGEPITLIYGTRWDNGEIAMFCGTPTRLYRFATAAAADYFLSNWAAADYVEDSATGWKLIGSGYSGHRWEAETVGGRVFFNNQVDLPVSIGFMESVVRPAYELRENGIASVGCICQSAGMLMCGNIKQITADKLEEILEPTASSGTASQNGAVSSGVVKCRIYYDTVIADGTGFNSGNAFTETTGRTILLANGHQATIASEESGSPITEITLLQVAPINGTTTLAAWKPALGSKTITVQGDLPFIVGDRVQIERKEAPDDVWAQGLITDYTGTSMTILVDDIEFPDSPAVQTITNGVVQPTHLNSLTDAYDVHRDLVFDLKWGTYYVESTESIFTEDDVGQYILWANGQTARIIGYSSATQVAIDTDRSFSSQAFSITNRLAYSAFTDTRHIDQFPWRILWSELDVPEQFSLYVPCSMTAGSKEVVFAYPTKAFEAGDEVVVLGAGTAGGNLEGQTTGTYPVVQYVSPDGMSMVLDVTAVTTTAADATVTKADSVGSIAGYVNLIDDGSGVIRIMPLQGDPVVYRDTSIWIGKYTANVDAPWQWHMAYNEVKTEPPKGLWFRNTLINVSDSYHLYGGRNHFYRFDLTNQTPIELPLGEQCKDMFFNNVSRGSFSLAELYTLELWGKVVTTLDPSAPPAIPPPPGDPGDSELLVEGGPGYFAISNLKIGEVYAYQYGADIDHLGTLYHITAAASYANVPYVGAVQEGTYYFSIKRRLRQAITGDYEDFVFTADNVLTGEVFLNFITNATDCALCFDYRHNTIRTTSAAFTAMASVQKPVYTGENREIWCVAGTYGGLLLRYGMLNQQPVSSGSIKASQYAGSPAAATTTVTASSSIFTESHVGWTIKFSDGTYAAIVSYTSATKVVVVPSRLITSAGAMTFTLIPFYYARIDAAYSSVIKSGLEAFNDEFHEKIIGDYVINVSSAISKVFSRVMLNGTYTPSVAISQLGAATITHATNLIPFYSRQVYLQDQITASNFYPMEFSSRIINVKGAGSGAIARFGS